MLPALPMISFAQSLLGRWFNGVGRSSGLAEP